MPKNLTLPQVLKLVTDLACLLPNFPSLQLHRVPEVVVNLNDGLHDQFAFADHINGFWVHSDVVKNLAAFHFNLVGEVVKVDQVNAVPCCKEGEIGKEFEPAHLFHDVVLVQDLLVVFFGQFKSHDVRVGNHCLSSFGLQRLV